MKTDYLAIIYDLLKKGGRFGKYNYKMRFPYFDANIYPVYSRGVYYIGWHNYGSSANKFTKKDLLWIITEIFNTTPEQFYRTHYVEFRNEIHY